MPGYFEDSFSTIAAYGANAAMMHYHAEGDVNSVIEPRGFLLVDNGGQYGCGTTAITRTYPVGPALRWIPLPAARSGRTRSTTAAAPATASALSPACTRARRACARTTP